MHESLQVALVVNPRARGVTPSVVDAVAALWEASFPTEVLTTSGRGAAGVLAGELAARCDVVAVLSGDGTLNEVANGVLGISSAPSRPSRPMLVPLPGGSTNVFARSIGLHFHPIGATAQAIAALASGRTRTVGVGRLNGRAFLSNAGVGFDASVVAKVEEHPDRKRRWGAGWFAACAVRELWVRRAHGGHPSPILRVSVGPHRVAARWALFLLRSPYTYAGPWPLDVEPRTGRDGLTAVCFESVDGVRMSAWATRALLTRHGIAGRDGIHRYVVADGAEVHAGEAAGETVCAQVDGEEFPAGDRFEVSYEPNVITTVGRTDSAHERSSPERLNFGAGLR